MTSRPSATVFHRRPLTHRQQKLAPPPVGPAGLHREVIHFSAESLRGFFKGGSPRGGSAARIDFLLLFVSSCESAGGEKKDREVEIFSNDELLKERGVAAK